MAASSRRKFSPQFKTEAVQLVLQSDRSIAEVAGEVPSSHNLQLGIVSFT